MIKVEGLKMIYKVHKKEPGFVGSMKSLVNRKFEIVEALKNVDLEIESGEVIGLIGPNGAGKTTFLKILSGLLNPTEGKVSVGGYVPFDRKREFRKMISLVMGQKSQLIWEISAMETFNVNKAIYEVNKSDFEQRLNELIDVLDVRKCLNLPVRQLSLGERMKMEIIASLLHFPKVLFLDEPTIGLDLKSQVTMRNFIKYYVEKTNTTVIITSHYMEDIKALCDRLVVINKGIIVFNGNFKQLPGFDSDHKYISVKTNNETIERVREFALDIETTKDSYKIKVPNLALNKVMVELGSSENVSDLTVENRPIEEIIMDILSERSNTQNDKVSGVF